MTNNITTTDLKDFGYRERGLAEELLKASREQGFPDDFNEDEIEIMFNIHSGNVFFTNSDCQVCMMNKDKLEMFFSCWNCSHEGFKEDMKHGEDDKDCQEFLKDIGVIEDETNKN